MQRLRLLATSLLTTTCVLPAASQSPAPPPSPTFAITLPPSDVHAFKPNAFHIDASKDGSWRTPVPDTQPFGVQVSDDTLKDLKIAHIQKINPLLEQIHPPCYTLRVYGFTPQDLKSPHPHASHETDCTPASSAHLKALQLPATVNAK